MPDKLPMQALDLARHPFRVMGQRIRFVQHSFNGPTVLTRERRYTVAFCSSLESARSLAELRGGIVEVLAMPGRAA